MERRIIQLQIEQQALEKEEDGASQQRLEKLTAELADLKAKVDALKAGMAERKSEFDTDRCVNGTDRGTPYCVRASQTCRQSRQSLRN